MQLQNSVLVIYFNHVDHIVPMGNFTREDIRIEVCKVLPPKQCNLTFFRQGEHLFTDETTKWFDSFEQFKNSLSV
jgi:hypothetical protein